MKQKYKYYFANVVIPVLVYGSITGMLAGTVVFFFKLAAEWICAQSLTIYTAAHQNAWLVPAIIVGAVALAMVVYLLQRWAEESIGGGIPRAEGVLRGVLTFRWFRTFIAVTINSFIGCIAGLPLGSEGILLGTATGGGTSQLPLSKHSWRRYIMTGGACAGFAVAVAAPVTGLLFALEGTHKRFTPMIFLMSMSSVVFGVAASNLWGAALGRRPAPLYDVSQFMGTFQMKDVWVPLLLGIIVAVAACAFNLLVIKIGHAYDTRLKKIPHWVKLIVVFVMVAVIGLISVGNFQGTDALYGGGTLIPQLAQNGIRFSNPSVGFSFAVVCILLAIRFFAIPFTTSSGATGGVLIPILSIGALLGAFSAELFVAMGMPAELYGTVVIIAMSAFLGAAIRVPLTALVFTVECTWNYSNLFYVGIAVFVSYLLCELVKIEPLYDALLDRMVEKQNQGKQHRILRLSYVVTEDAFAVSKSVRDILWPANTKVTVVKNQCSQMDDDGERKIRAGDTITLISQTYDVERTKHELEQILGKQLFSEITCDDHPDVDAGNANQD